LRLILHVLHDLHGGIDFSLRLCASVGEKSKKLHHEEHEEHDERRGGRECVLTTNGANFHEWGEGEWRPAAFHGGEFSHKKAQEAQKRKNGGMQVMSNAEY
jgi:hypothetical protein